MKINQLKGGVILSYFQMALRLVIGIAYTPVMLRLLGQSEYGIYQLSVSTIAYLDLFGFGLSSTFIRFSLRYKAKNDKEGEEKLNGLFLKMFSIIAVFSAAAGFVIIRYTPVIYASLTAPELQKLKTLLVITVFNAIVMILTNIFSYIIRINEKFFVLNLLSLLTTLLNPFLALPLLLLGYKSEALVAITLFFTVMHALFTVYYCFKVLRVKFNFKSVGKGTLKEILIFSSFIFLGEIVDLINSYTDKTLLGMFSGTSVIAVYSVGTMFKSFFISFSVAISSVFVPRVNKMAALEVPDEEITGLFIKVGRIQYIVLMMALSGFIVFGRAFLGLWVGPGYSQAYWIALICLIPFTVPLIQNLGVAVQKAKNMHKFRSVVYVFIAIGNVLLSIPLIKLYGGIGAVTATAIALTAGNIIAMNIYYQKKVGINVCKFWLSILNLSKALLLPVLFGVFIINIVQISGWLELALYASVYIFLYALSMWLFGMNTFEKELISKPVKRLMRKKHSGGGER